MTVTTTSARVERGTDSVQVKSNWIIDQIVYTCIPTLLFDYPPLVKDGIAYVSPMSALGQSICRLRFADMLTRMPSVKRPPAVKVREDLSTEYGQTFCASRQMLIASADKDEFGMLLLSTSDDSFVDRVTIDDVLWHCAHPSNMLSTRPNANSESNSNSIRSANNLLRCERGSRASPNFLWTIPPSPLTGPPQVMTSPSMASLTILMTYFNASLSGH